MQRLDFARRKGDTDVDSFDTADLGVRLRIAELEERRANGTFKCGSHNVGDGGDS